MTIFLFPQLFKLMLCFMYLVGPLFFLLTISALIVQISFINCCNLEVDKCEEFYPYKNAFNVIVLLVVSLLFSIAASILLISLLINVILTSVRTSFFHYNTL